MKRALAALLLMSVASTAAAEVKPGVTIAPMVGLTTFKDGLDNETHFSLGLGYQFDNPWAVEFVYSSLSADPDTNLGIPVEVDFTRWHIDGVYHLQQEEPVVPYLSLGLGRGEYEALGIEADETLFNVGGGVKWQFAENTAARLEAKAFAGDDDIDGVEFAISLGIHHVFAAAKQSKPVVTAPAAPRDSDRDGVIDDMDDCPNTLSGTRVDAKGCPVDTDGDGVTDDKDRCPETTDRRARIDAEGCYVVLTEQVKVELNVEFDNDSAEARAEHKDEVRPVYEFMSEYPLTRVTIEGHTDSRGSADYNRDLSQRRADTIAGILVDEFGIDASRVRAIGYGEERPIASNETAEGRQQNRRVVGVVEAQVETIQRR